MSLFFINIHVKVKPIIFFITLIIILLSLHCFIVCDPALKNMKNVIKVLKLFIINRLLIFCRLTV